MPRAKTSEIPYNTPCPSGSTQRDVPHQGDPSRALIERAQIALARRTRLPPSPKAIAVALFVLLSFLFFLAFSAGLSYWNRPHILDGYFPPYVEEGKSAKGWVRFQDRNGDVTHLLFEPVQGRFFGFMWSGPFWLTSSTGFLEFHVGLGKAEQGRAAFRLVLVDKDGHATCRVVRLSTP